MTVKRTMVRWGAKWRSKNKLDGITEHIVFDNLDPVLSHTKKGITEFIKERYGYIAKRKDLRQEPHGWRMPKPIKLKITMTEFKGKI